MCLTFLLDEFANLSSGPLPSILPALYVGRSYGCQLAVFVQDRAALKRYAEPSAFETQSEIIQIWGIRALDDARWIEERAGRTTVATESGSPSSLSLSETGVPVLSRADALQLPDYKQAIVYRNKPVLLADLVSYRAVRPWADQAAPLPGDAHAPAIPGRIEHLVPNPAGILPLETIQPDLVERPKDRDHPPKDAIKAIDGLWISIVGELLGQIELPRIGQCRHRGFRLRLHDRLDQEPVVIRHAHRVDLFGFPPIALKDALRDNPPGLVFVQPDDAL